MGENNELLPGGVGNLARITVFCWRFWRPEPEKPDESAKSLVLSNWINPNISRLSNAMKREHSVLLTVIAVLTVSTNFVPEQEY